MTQFVDKAGLEVALDKIKDRVDKAVASINPDGPTITHTIDYSLIDENKGFVTNGLSYSADLSSSGSYNRRMIVIIADDNDANLISSTITAKCVRISNKVGLSGEDFEFEGLSGSYTKNTSGDINVFIRVKSGYTGTAYLDVRLYGLTLNVKADGVTLGTFDYGD